MKILGIDPGTTTIGYGIIDFDGENYSTIDFGTIKTTPKAPASEKIAELTNDLKKIIQLHNPTEIGIEEVFFSKNVKTGLQVAEARGAIIYLLTLMNKPFTQYKPLIIKQNICGYGGADKESIKKMIGLILDMKIEIRSDDAADALAIAVCHGNHLKMQKLLG